MSSSSSASVTSLLFSDTDPQALAASIIYANPTATAYLVNCPPGTDSNDCGTYNETITVGPWAAPSPSVTTGFYDVYVNIPDETFTYSLHCSMTSTVPSVCTVINNGGNNDGTPTLTFTNSESYSDLVGWTYLPVTITAGLEKLASVSAMPTATASSPSSGSTAASSSSPASAGSASTGSSAMSGSNSIASTASGSVSSTAASSTSSTNGATSSAFSDMDNLGLAGLALAWLLR